MTDTLREAEAALRSFALGLPEAREEFPWGERVVKVNKKVFVFMGLPDELDSHLLLNVKLPQSGGAVLTLPFARPSGYGLGASGWVRLEFAPDDEPPVDLLIDWIEESYRAIAPKRLIAQIEGKRS